MKRRHFLSLLIAAPLVPALGQEAHAAHAALAAGWNAAPAAERIAAQDAMRRADFYFGDADGLWSLATERAMLRTIEAVALAGDAALLRRIHQPAEARAFVKSLAEDRFAGILEPENEPAWSRWFERHFTQG